MKKDNKRFIRVLKEGSQLLDDGLKEIIVDTETGVNYLVIKSGYGMGITPLLDKEGKPVITKVDVHRSRL